MPSVELLCSTTFFILRCFCLAIGQKTVEPTCRRWKSLKPWTDRNLSSLKLSSGIEVKRSLTNTRKLFRMSSFPFPTYKSGSYISHSFRSSSFITNWSKLCETTEQISSIRYIKEIQLLIPWSNGNSVLMTEVGIADHTILKKRVFTSGWKHFIPLVKKFTFFLPVFPRILLCKNDAQEPFSSRSLSRSTGWEKMLKMAKRRRRKRKRRKRRRGEGGRGKGKERGGERNICKWWDKWAPSALKLF